MLKYLPIPVLMLSLSGCFNSSPLHNSMEDMGDSFKTMKDSNEVAEIQAQLTTFKAAFDIAQAQTIKPEHQQDFDKGMEKVKLKIAAIEVALAANDLETAKKLMQELGSVRKEYHEKLGVK